MIAMEDAVPPGLGRRVLLVDDDAMQLKLVKVSLEAAGFDVDAARGPADAERLLHGRPPPAAIVTDIVMDDIDGFTFCKRVRTDPSLADVPVVLLSSAFDEEEDRSLARAFGANALVSRSAGEQACIEALVRSMAEGVTHRVASQPPRDLYDRRLVHQLARLSERQTTARSRFGMLFEHATDAICLLCPDGRVLDVNRKWEEITNESRDDLVGRNVRDLVSARDEEQPASRENAVVVRRADGATIFLEFTTTVLELDGSPAVLSIGRDVTSLVEARRRLEASEQMYRSLVENIPEVVWSATRDWKYLFFSPNLEKLSGYTPDEVIAGESLGRLHPADAARVRSAQEATAASGAPFDIEYRWQHRDGRWLWIHARAVVNGDRIDGIFCDITKRKELEEHLWQSQKIEALGQLTAGLAHDFNNVLSVIGLGAQQLVETLAQDDPCMEIAQDMCEGVRRGAELTQRLLTFSRRQPCAPEPIDVAALLTGMQRMLARVVGSAITIDVANAPDLGPVHADRGQFEQVVMNLVVNARDAIEEKGTIRIRTDRVVVDEREHVRVSVTDDGCGMAEATRLRVFEPFFTTKKDGRGTGLGLAMCHGIVRSAGGTMAVESEPGRGTTFHVYLPVERAPATR